MRQFRGRYSGKLRSGGPHSALQGCAPPTHALLASGRGHRIVKHEKTYVIYGPNCTCSEARPLCGKGRGRTVHFHLANGRPVLQHAPFAEIPFALRNAMRAARECADPAASMPRCMGAASCHAWPGRVSARMGPRPYPRWSQVMCHAAADVLCVARALLNAGAHRHADAHV